MCGIFGFIAKFGRHARLSTIKNLAADNETRGDHAFGFAHISDGQMHVYKQPGAVTRNMSALNACSKATAIIGHCRYATHGLPANNVNNHPHVSGSGYYVHNGVVCNHENLINKYKLTNITECDSEVIGLMISRYAGGIEKRAAFACGKAEGNLAILGLWNNPVRFLFARHVNPLYFGESDDGFYFSSIAKHLPGVTLSLKSNNAYCMQYSRRKRLLVIDSTEF